MPQYAVISVGTNNFYGHPAEAALSRLRDADVKVYRTDLQGDIICTSDGKTISFSVQKNDDVDSIGLEPNSTGLGGNVDEAYTKAHSTVPTEISYILNTNTHKFHYPSCSSVGQMSEKNKNYYSGTREEVIDMGYSPCGRCHP